MLVSVVFLVVYLWRKPAVVNGDFVAALAFGLVEGVVGTGIQAGECILGVGDGAADAQGDGMVLGAVVDGRGNGVTDSFTELLRVVFGWDIGKVQAEFIAPHAADDIRMADMLTKNLYDVLQDFIPGLMAGGIVDGLKIIDIQHDKGTGNPFF